MNGITASMALVDFIPVAFFFIAAVILQRDLYPKLSKGAFALLAAGSIMVLIGGFYKALWKLLYALEVCDFVAIDKSFFPMQGPGFMLVFLSLVSYTSKEKQGTGSGTTALSVAPVIYESNLVFIILQVIGYSGLQFCLCRTALKMKRKLAAMLFVLAFVFIMGMGYLGARFDDSSSMHWIAQLTNILGQGSMLGGVLILHKAGLA